MKLKGFTLAEVLITLSLIGVVASLTLPALLADVQRQQAGPALIRALATIDMANALVVNEHELYSFRQGCGNNYADTCFPNWIAGKMGVAATDPPANGYVDFHGEELGDILGAAYLSKNGFIYYMPGAENASLGSESESGESLESSESPENPESPISDDHVAIFIDVNGEKGPNMLGKDLFEAIIDLDTGTVYGRGSKLDTSTTADEKWTVKCTSPEDEGFDAHFCAGSVVDNGGKVIYKW